MKPVPQPGDACALRCSSVCSRVDPSSPGGFRQACSARWQSTISRPWTAISAAGFRLRRWRSVGRPWSRSLSSRSTQLRRASWRLPDCWCRWAWRWQGSVPQRRRAANSSPCPGCRRASLIAFAASPPSCLPGRLTRRRAGWIRPRASCRDGRCGSCAWPFSPPQRSTWQRCRRSSCSPCGSPGRSGPVSCRTRRRRSSRCFWLPSSSRRCGPLLPPTRTGCMQERLRPSLPRRR